MFKSLKMLALVSLVLALAILYSPACLFHCSPALADEVGAPAAKAPTLKVTETSYGKIDWYDGLDLFCSPDARHAAWIAVKEGKKYIMLDGIAGKTYEDVGKPIFSPDSKRLAYWAKSENKYFFVVDGIEGDKYDAVGNVWGNRHDEEHAPLNFVFSPDSMHFAYRAQQDNKSMLVVDGMPETIEYDYVYYPVFSPDSKRLAYCAGRDGKAVFVVDGKEEKADYDGIMDIPVFSPDSERVAYIAHRYRGTGMKSVYVVVVDGKEGKEYDYIQNLMFSPDSAKVLYIAYRDHKFYTVIDDKEIVGPYRNPRLIPDSERKAYERYSRDGLGGKVGDLIFSPDSKRFAYWNWSQENHNCVAVVDGVVGNAYDDISGIIFSPDSKRVAYIALRRQVSLVVVDGLEGKKYDGITGLVFSPDSRHVAYMAWGVAKALVVVDGVETIAYGPYPPAFPPQKWPLPVLPDHPVFDSPNKAHALMFRDTELFLVEIEITE